MTRSAPAFELYQVDAFTDTPFKGNPAGVCLLSHQRPDDWMMGLAAEMNLSETAFVREQSDGYGLRWFTPKTEVSLCGHATLASAHVLWEEGIVASGTEIRFQTLSGTLPAHQDGKLIELDFPTKEVEPAPTLPDLNKALGVTPTFTGAYEREKGSTYLLEVGSEEAVRAIEPDYARLVATGGRTVIVTARSSDGDFDFVSRFFAPVVGINEDPVTGSAHCYLAPYWGRKLGKRDMIGHQVSARSGVVRCR
ncbi:MAG TPA: PhzF family phenazine biosynthesis protein, partial [Spirochaetia bacterium]|nr:PhzF family phenazine biosynthesis protein [Spirochaetia bacterium]